MGFLDALAEVRMHEDTCKLALRRAGNRELAEDALQQTYWTVAQTPNPERIQDLYAYFRRALINEIHHQLIQPASMLIGNIDAIADLGPECGPSPRSYTPPSIDKHAATRILAERLLVRLERHRDQLTACVPARSGDPERYQSAMFAAARQLLCLLLHGSVVQADWNAVIKAAYPPWFNAPGHDEDARHQRISRARRDIKTLLQRIASQAELAS